LFFDTFCLSLSQLTVGQTITVGKVRDSVRLSQSISQISTCLDVKKMRDSISKTVATKSYDKKSQIKDSSNFKKSVKKTKTK